MRCALFWLFLIPLAVGCALPTDANPADTGEVLADGDSSPEEESVTNPDPDADSDVTSCWVGEFICVEPNEPDNDTWCTNTGGEPSLGSCADGATGQCDFPPGGQYTAPATAFYYNDNNWAFVCNGAGGVYTAL